MRIIIDCDPDRYVDALSVIAQEIANVEKYNKPGWGWTFNSRDGRFFTRAIKGGFSVTQTHPTRAQP